MHEHETVEMHVTTSWNFCLYPSTFSAVFRLLCKCQSKKVSPITSIQNDTILMFCSVWIFESSWEFQCNCEQQYTNTACSLDNSLNETKYNGQANKKNIFYNGCLQAKFLRPTGFVTLPICIMTNIIGASKNILHQKKCYWKITR